MNTVIVILNQCLLTFKSIWFWLQLIFLGLWTLRLWGKITEESSDGDNTVLSWLSALGIIIVASFFIFCPWILTDTCSYNYLLSAISQSLAALFALVFALMFTLTQLSKSNKTPNKQEVANKKIGKIFTKYVLIYIVSFVIAMLAPLFLMGTDNTLWVKIVLYYAVFNVAMLIPFFWRFKITLTRKKPIIRKNKKNIKT